MFNKKLLILIFITIFSTNLIFSTTNITSCQILSTSGQYTLNQSISISGTTGKCLDIQTSNIEIDCQNYNISTTISDNYGIYTNGFNNITIKNCNFYKFDIDAIFLWNSNYNSLSNIYIENVVTSGIKLTNSNYNKISNINTFNFTTTTIAYSLTLSSSSYNNLTNLNSNYSGSIYIQSNSNNNNLKDINIINRIGSSTYGINLNTVINNTIENIKISDYTQNSEAIIINSANFTTINNAKIINNKNGIRFYGKSYNTIISNSDITFSTSRGINIDGNEIGNVSIINSTIINNTQDIYDGAGSSFPSFNIFFWGNILNSSSISSDWQGIYFNKTINGQNIGNYWVDFGNCNTYEIRNGFYICTNPSPYIINSTYSIYDYASLGSPYQTPFIPTTLEKNAFPLLPYQSIFIILISIIFYLFL